MLKFAEELLTKKFTGDSMKDAYMQAVKWYASNVLAKDELHNIQVEFEKDKQSPTVTIRLYVTMGEEVVRQEHCNICKEFHHSFFINEAENCNSCSVSGYQKRLDRQLNVKREYYRDLLRQRGVI